MKTICSISGLEFEILGFGNCYIAAKHPIFNLDYKQLLLVTDSWQDRRLNEDETLLLTLAFASESTLFTIAENIDCRALTISECENAIPKLIQLLDFLHDTCRNLNISDYFPALIVRDYEDINSLCSWLTSCLRCTYTYFAGIAETKEIAANQAKKAKVKALCNKTSSSPELYGRRLASWACAAANFPETPLNVEGINKSKTIADYWCYIIQCAATRQKDNRIYTIYENDIVELREHCIESLDLSIDESWIVIELLKATLKDVSFLSDSHFDIVLQEDRDLEYLTIELLQLPVKASYGSNLLAYLKDKALYDSQQKALINSNSNSNSNSKGE